jgi:hypothetical protein
VRLYLGTIQMGGRPHTFFVALDGVNHAVLLRLEKAANPIVNNVVCPPGPVMADPPAADVCQSAALAPTWQLCGHWRTPHNRIFHLYPTSRCSRQLAGHAYRRIFCASATGADYALLSSSVRHFGYQAPLVMRAGW